jgi:hypothetical protein
MKRSNLTILLYLFLVFASGLVVGAFGFRLYSGTPVSAKTLTKVTPEEWRRQYLSEMQSRLKLTPEQMNQLDATLDVTRARVRQAHDTVDATIKQVREDQVVKIRAMLTDAQRPEYEKLRAEREQRAKAAAAAQK